MPYSFEPLASSNNENMDSEGNIQQQSSRNSRLVNIRWCKCNNCQQMETNTERFCCAEADGMFESKLTLCVLLIPHLMPHSFSDFILEKRYLLLTAIILQFIFSSSDIVNRENILFPQKSHFYWKMQPSRHLLIQIQQWKHQNSLGNLFKVNYRGIRARAFTLFWCL